MGKLNTIQQNYLYRDLMDCKKYIEEKPFIFSTLENSFKRIDEIAEKPLKLAILGEFSAGKSTFVNRLIGKEILPTGNIPITSAITVLEYGEAERIEIVYESHNGLLVKKEYEGYDKLFDFQKSKQSEDDLIKVKKIRVFIKNNLLKDFHIIDTPGFNDANNMGEATEDIFDDINYVIWLFDASKAGTKTEEDILTKFRKLSLYEDNLYAVFNKGDIVAKDDNEYKEKYNELLKNNKLKDNFTNKKPLLISSLPDKGKLWDDKFEKLKDELQVKILRKDTEISRDQLRQETEELEKDLSLSIVNAQKLNEEVKSLFSSFIGESAKSSGENSDKLQKQLLKVIRSGIDASKQKLENSSSYKKRLLESILKFTSFYFTAENLDEMQKIIVNGHQDYFKQLSDSFEEFKEKLESLRKDNAYNDQEFDVAIDKRLDGISSNLKALQKSKKLLTNGYIIGLLSDDYIYNLLEKDIDTDASLNDETINNLLQMDLDISYFINEISSIGDELNLQLVKNLDFLGKALKYPKKALKN